MRMSLFTGLLAAAMIFGTSLMAQDDNAYDEAAFRQAQSEGKTIVLEVYAAWCPACNIQSSRLEALLREKPEFANVRLFVISNGDSEMKQAFQVSSRGTVIVFRGSRETGRSILETDRDALATLIESGL
jgi:thioredoxin 1